MAAGDAVTKGTNAFTEQHVRRRWQIGRGWFHVREFHGPFDATKIAAQEAACEAAGAEEIQTDEGWPTVITAAYPDESQTISASSTDYELSAEWSLEPYDLSKTLESHGYFHFTAIAIEAMAAIDAALKRGEGYDRNWDTEYGTGGSQLRNYARCKAQGIDSWLTSGFMLRKTIIADRAADFVRELQSANTEAGKVCLWQGVAGITNPVINGGQGVPADARIERPWVRIYMGVTDDLPYGTKSGTPPGFCDVWLDEWLAKPPAVGWQKQGRIRKRRLVQEWVGAVQWTGVLYDGGSGYPTP